MPSHEEHCQNSLKKYGGRFDELHRWMDEPCIVMGREHRMYRHDPYITPKEAKKIFGEYADQACLDHIILDWRKSPDRFKQYERRGMPAGICPRCGLTLVWRRARLSGELYRGCTNYPGCKYHERSYKKTPRGLIKKESKDKSKMSLSMSEDDMFGIWHSHEEVEEKEEEEIAIPSTRKRRKAICNKCTLEHRCSFWRKLRTSLTGRCGDFMKFKKLGEGDEDYFGPVLR